MKVEAASGRFDGTEKRPEPASTLDWLLLKRVSRSFYLTLRILPGPVREPISLAYLLARLSDTEADGAVSDAERELLVRRAELEGWLATSPDHEEIQVVWATIREGQQFDTRRFASADAEPLSDGELDRYTYLVAGCVGEFWTEICAKKLPGFTRLPIDRMKMLGINFGKGLQLVNILRDREADARLGRIYVPPGRRAEVFSIARKYLQDAEEYTRALKPWRLRAACALPFLLARETLDLVERNPEATRAKVSRVRVWMLLGEALLFR